VVTSGGIVGKVTKVKDDGEIEVEIAENTRVRVIKSTVVEVRTKGEPVKEAA
jgi:preprotein translocase subunit YajC